MHDKIPHVYFGKFENQNSLLDFLHEAGHLRAYDIVIESAKAKRATDRERKYDSGNAIPKSLLKALKVEIGLVIKSERDAWAFALKEAREIEKRLGINLVSKHENERIVESAKEHVRKNLGAYEKYFLSEQTFHEAKIKTMRQLEAYFVMQGIY